MSRVIHLSSVHKPYDVRIFHKECKSLVQAGHEVTLLVAHPCDCTRDGVRFIHVKTPSGRLLRMFGTTSRLFHIALGLDADIYHFHDPELIPVGLRLKINGKRVIYDVHEEYPMDILEKKWIPAPVRAITAGIVYCIEGVAARIFDGVIASRPALLPRFPRGKTALVNNFPILGELGRPGATPIAERPFICAYVGGMSPERGFLELVRALGHLPESVQLELHIAGLVEPIELVEQAKVLPGWRRVKLLGWQNRDQVADLLGRARFGVVTFLPIPNHLRSYPTKLFEYMSAGLPTLASDLPLWREIIQDAGIGRLANPSNPKEFSEALQWMVEHPDACEEMGRNGVRLVNDTYNWTVESGKMLKLYDQILKAK